MGIGGITPAMKLLPKGREASKWPHKFYDPTPLKMGGLPPQDRSGTPQSPADQRPSSPRQVPAIAAAAMGTSIASRRAGHYTGSVWCCPFCDVTRGAENRECGASPQRAQRC